MDPSNAEKKLPIPAPLPQQNQTKAKTNQSTKQNQSSDCQEISIEVIVWIYCGERKNKIRLNQNVECRKMAPALRKLTLKL